MKLTKEEAHQIAFYCGMNGFSLLVQKGDCVVTKKQIQLIATYCGMYEARAEAFLTVAAGQCVHSATMTHFRDNDLIFFQAGCYDLTPTGHEVLVRIQKILAGEFTPPPALFDADQLRAMDTMRLARKKEIKATNLRSVDLKILRSVALCPGSCYGYLHTAYTFDQLDHLLGSKYLAGRKNYKYAALTVAEKGLRVLGLCLEIAS